MPAGGALQLTAGEMSSPSQVCRASIGAPSAHGAKSRNPAAAGSAPVPAAPNGSSWDAVDRNRRQGPGVDRRRLGRCGRGVGVDRPELLAVARVAGGDGQHGDSGENAGPAGAGAGAAHTGERRGRIRPWHDSLRRVTDQVADQVTRPDGGPTCPADRARASRRRGIQGCTDGGEVQRRGCPHGARVLHGRRGGRPPEPVAARGGTALPRPRPRRRTGARGADAGGRAGGLGRGHRLRRSRDARLSRLRHGRHRTQPASRLLPPGRHRRGDRPAGGDHSARPAHR